MRACTDLGAAGLSLSPVEPLRYLLIVTPQCYANTCSIWVFLYLECSRPSVIFLLITVERDS